MAATRGNTPTTGSSSGGDTTIACSSGLAVSAGDLLLVSVSWTNAVTVTGVSDGTHTYLDTGVEGKGSGNDRVRVFYQFASASGTYTPTATFSGSATFRNIIFEAWGGVPNAAPEVVQGMTGGDSTSPGELTLSLNSSKEYFIFFSLGGNNIVSSGAGTGGLTAWTNNSPVGTFTADDLSVGPSVSSFTGGASWTGSLEAWFVLLAWSLTPGVASAITPDWSRFPKYKMRR